MIHLIRHAPKAWDNGRGPPRHWNAEGASHDPPINWSQQADQKALQLADQLLAQEDEPWLILTSPFLRCRQTAALMSSRWPQIEPITCPILREYLGNWRPSQVVLTLRTQREMNITEPPIESLDEFHNRIENIVQWLIFTFESAGHHSIWVITHGTVMRRVFRKLEKLGYPVACHFQD